MIQYGLNLPVREIKAAGDGTFEVSGYASTFGSVDLGGDVVMRGAFDRTLSSGQKVKFLFAHDPSQVLGVPLDLKADDHGLFGQFKISRTRLGEEVHTLLKDGALDSFSIGFFIDDLDFDPETGVRLLKAIDLLEVSVVAIPMNPEAVVTRVKSRSPGPMTMDEEAAYVVSTIAAFKDRCADLADIRLGQGKPPLSLAVSERLTSVRTAVDELLSIKAATKASPAAPPPTEDPPAAPVEAAPPSASAGGASYATTIALKRARLLRAGILEKPSDVHDSGRSAS